MNMTTRATTGDVLVTEIGEVYVYLGYYTGAPSSLYNVPSEGHLYLFIGNTQTASIDLLYILKEISARDMAGFDGNACYTKSKKRFTCRIGHVDLSEYMCRLKIMFGIVRVGDNKPR